MSKLESYFKLSKDYEVYYGLKTDGVLKWVCLDSRGSCDSLEPLEALALLAWLRQQEMALWELVRRQSEGK